ncbi:MAG TPA: hypothetical protein VMH80_11190 [Bryobacteraceae bacterium]|nr:hypothetical protein [Bryobacteraceae bacterium]
MRLKGRLARLMMAGGLAVMMAGISQAGGASWTPGDPPPNNGVLVCFLAIGDVLGTMATSIVNLL